MNRTHLICVALTLILLGCGSSPTQKTPNSDSNAMNPNSSPNVVFTPNNGTGGDAEGRIWDAICQAAFNCGGVNPELLLVIGRYSSESDCKSNPLPGLDFDTAQINASVEAGRARWDAAKAEQCFQSLEDGLCEGGGLFEQDSETCDQVIVGLIPEGSACAWDNECETGNCRSEGEDCYGTCTPNCGEENCASDEYCNFDGIGVESCLPRAGVGGVCSWSGECESGLDCGDGATCEQPAGGRDFRLLNQGDACVLSGETVDSYCKAGLVCTNLVIEGESLMGTCGSAQATGGACRIAFECQIGLKCDAPSPADQGTCVAAGADGASCSQDFDCLSTNCDEGTCVTPEPDPVCELP